MLFFTYHHCLKLAKVSLLPALLCIGACSPPPTGRNSDGGDGAPVVVFVSILPQATFVNKIAGELVQVQVMVAPGQSPHTYEPTPRQMITLSQAALYFRIGVPFENVWMNRVAKNNPNLKIIDTRDGIELRHMAAHHHHDDGDDADAHANHHDDDCEKGEQDPHIWLAPQLVKIQAATICRALQELRPEHADVMQANLAAFHQELDDLDREIQGTLKPLNNRKFMVFHPSWGYFADAYGLEQIAIEVEGKEPGAKALVTIIDEARKEQIKTIFVQKQFSTRTAIVIARATDAKVVQIDPLAADYSENLRAVAKAIAGGHQ